MSDLDTESGPRWPDDSHSIEKIIPGLRFAPRDSVTSSCAKFRGQQTVSRKPDSVIAMNSRRSEPSDHADNQVSEYRHEWISFECGSGPVAITGLVDHDWNRWRVD